MSISNEDIRALASKIETLKQYTSAVTLCYEEGLFDRKEIAYANLLVKKSMLLSCDLSIPEARKPRGKQGGAPSKK